MTENLFTKGMAKLMEVDGRSGEAVIERLRGIAPDMGRYIVEFAFGEIMSRPGLDLKSREIATVAALTAMGGCEPQLAVHINGLLNVGATRAEVVEIMLQMAVYAGFPAALNALFTAEKVFAERDAA
jgi:4-carboxymuconolactone decarboxylase